MYIRLVPKTLGIEASNQDRNAFVVIHQSSKRHAEHTCSSALSSKMFYRTLMHPSQGTATFLRQDAFITPPQHDTSVLPGHHSTSRRTIQCYSWLRILHKNILSSSRANHSDIHKTGSGIALSTCTAAVGEGDSTHGFGSPSRSMPWVRISHSSAVGYPDVRATRYVFSCPYEGCVSGLI